MRLRKLSIILLVIILLLSITACGTDKGETTSNPTNEVSSNDTQILE
jgi:predicted small lipoprotein YifL